MKKVALTLALLASTCLSACQKVKSETAIYSFQTANSDEKVNQVDASTVEYMINNGFCFNLLLYTQGCSYCEKAQESVQEEQSRTHIFFYKIEMDAATIKYLCDSFPALFKIDDAYPALYLFDDGEISYNIQYDKLIDYKTLHRNLYPQIKETKNFILSNDEYFDYVLNEATTALVYTYDSSKPVKGDDLGEKVFNAVINAHDSYGVFIDKNNAKTALISKFYDYFDFTEDDNFDYLFSLEHGQIKTTVRYLTDDGNQIDSLLLSLL